MLPKGNSFVLGIPLNSKSATYNVFQAQPLYQPNDDGKTASVYQFPKPYVAIATDNTKFAELAASTLQQCTGSNRIKLCRKGFSTTTDEELLCLTSLYFNQNIPALRNFSFPLSFFQKPHRQSTRQMASTTSFLATPQWISKTTADHMDSVCPLSIVRHVSFDQVFKVPFILIKAILSCHPTWMHVKRLRNHTLQQSKQSNWHPLWTECFRTSRLTNSIFRVTQSVQPGNQILRVYIWNWLKFQTLDEWTQILCKNRLNQLLHTTRLSILPPKQHSTTFSQRKLHP